MRALFFLIVVLLLVPACSSSNSCMTKACPNDPDLVAAQIDQCNAQRSKCSSPCGSYFSCLDSHAKDNCGTDGKLDATKVIEVTTVTCKSTVECTRCVQAK